MPRFLRVGALERKSPRSWRPTNPFAICRAISRISQANISRQPCSRRWRSWIRSSCPYWIRASGSGRAWPAPPTSSPSASITSTMPAKWARKFRPNPSYSTRPRPASSAPTTICGSPWIGFHRLGSGIGRRHQPGLQRSVEARRARLRRRLLHLPRRFGAQEPDRAGRQWVKGKSFKTFGPSGPGS